MTKIIDEIIYFMNIICAPLAFKLSLCMYFDSISKYELSQACIPKYPTSLTTNIKSFAQYDRAENKKILFNVVQKGPPYK